MEVKHSNTLLDLTNSLGARMRALFELRTVNSAESRKVLVKALQNENNSTLMRHEIAFALGQMQHKDVVQDLIKLLMTFDEDIVVRHECAEALGAIGDESGRKALETCLDRKSVV